MRRRMILSIVISLAIAQAAYGQAVDGRAPAKKAEKAAPVPKAPAAHVPVWKDPLHTWRLEADQVGTYSFSTGAPLNSVSGSPGTPAAISVTVDPAPCSTATLSPTASASVINPGLAVGSGAQPAAQVTPCASPPPTSTTGTGSSSGSVPMLPLLISFAFGGLAIAAVSTKRRGAVR